MCADWRRRLRRSRGLGAERIVLKFAPVDPQVSEPAHWHFRNFVLL